jgi:amino acid adenylation domain-containing protein
VTLVDLIRAAARRSPDADALVGLTTRWSWAEVDRAVEAIAAALVADGVAPGDRVAVARLKDDASFIAVHAILRAGAVVVPVDPFAPRDVARGVLADAAVSAVIGDHRTVTTIAPDELDGLELRSVIVDDGDTGAADIGAGRRSWSATIAEPPTAALPQVGHDDDAYIIYTSGSTGRPKGIVHTHRSGLAYAERAVAAHGVTATDRIAGIPPLHFDQATFELYAAPLAGAAVVVMGEPHVRFPAALVERTEAERVTIWYSVPSLFRQLIERGGMDQRDLGPLRLIKYGGEVFPAGALNRLHELVPGAAVTNVYGPAEVNECTNHRLDLPLTADADVPIGRPWAGVSVRVVDGDGAEVAPGEPGQLLVSGPTTMRGYWRQCGLTEAALTVDAEGRCWYATGDVVSADADGLLRFFGRSDNQVKIRGVRVELEGVEAVVGDGPGIAEAVVGPTTDRQSLVAAVVTTGGADLDEKALRRWCSTRLAQAAVPRSFRRVDQLPTTPSGKIDRAAVRRRLAADEDTR